MAFGGGFGAGQQKTVFGAPAPASNNAFGAPAASSGFGAPTQSAGLFGSPNPAPTTAAGGLFGAAPGANPATANTGFGLAAKPAFGAAAAAPATGIFGASASAAQPSLFGTPANTGGSLFGGAPSAGLFGASATGSGFGAAAAQPAGASAGAGGLFGGASAAAGPGAGTTGTASVRYQVTTELGQNNATEKYVSISVMPQFRNKAVEELRMEDYAAGIKSKAQVPGAGSVFGSPAQQTGGFGAQPAASTGGLFGAPAATSAFGAQPPAQPSLFGGQSAAATPFGQPAPAQSTGLFGNTQNNTGSLFGQQQPAQTQGGLFGTPQSQPAPSTGLFGAGQQQSSPFGAAQPTQSTGLFGAAAPKTSLFGGTPASTPAFGAPASNTGGLFSGAGQQPAASGFGFGASQSTAPTTSLFGASSAAQPAQNAFGAAPAAKPFGAQATTGGFSFANNTAKPLGTGLVGASQPALGGGGLGLGTGAFGSTPAPGGLFSNPAVGAAPTTGLGAPGGGLNLNLGNSQSAFGTGGLGLGASQPNQAGRGGLGLGLGAQPAGGFGAAGLSQPAGNQQLQAGIAANPYGTQPLFNGTQTGQGAGLLAPQPGAAPGQPGALGLSPAPLGAKGPPTSPAFASSPLYRRAARSVPRVRPRGTRRRLGSGANGGPNTSSLFEAASPAPGFSPEQFLARTGLDGAGQSGNGDIDNDEASNGKKTSQSIKTLVIKNDRPPNRGSTNGDATHTPLETRKDVRFVTTPTQPSSSAARSSEERLSVTPAKESLGRQSNGSSARASPGTPFDSSFVKPTPRRLAAQYVADGHTPALVSPGSSAGKVYSTYRDFYNEQIYPVGSDTPGSSQMATPNDSNQHEPPILTRQEYYTRPPMATLRMLKPEALRAVNDFTIGRKDVGEVTWPGLTDLSSLNLDTIVYIEPKEVLVYPDEASKPAEGVELNKPADVTLHGIWRRSKTTGEPTTDSAAIIKFVEKLKTQCELDQTTFLEYEATKGTWRFRVKHFSRYGFKDSEDDEETDDNQVSNPLNRLQNIPTGKTKPIKAPSPWSDDEETGVSGMDESSESSDGSGLGKGDSKKDMVTSTARFTPVEPLLRSLEAPRLQTIRSSVFSAEKTHSPMEIGAGPIQTEIAVQDDQEWTRSVKSRLVVSKHAGPGPGSVVLQTIPKYTKFSESLLFSKGTGWEITRSKNDAALFMGCSFRVSFGSKGQLLVPRPPSVEGSSYVIDERTLYASTAKASLERRLKIHCSAWRESTVEKRSLLVPCLESCFRGGNGQNVQLFEDLAEDDEDHFAAVVFRLLDALYGSSPEASSSIRVRLSEWLRDHACDWSQDDPSKGKGNLDEVFGLLSGGKVDSASLALMNLGDVRMASLVTQSMSARNAQFREDCKNQLQLYREAKDQDDSWERRKNILEVLAGEAHKVSGVLSLSWYRAFGLHFWYGAGSETYADDTAGVGGAIESYSKDWHDHLSERFEIGCKPPLAQHKGCEQSLSEQRQAVMASPDLIDISYQLLCLYGGVGEKSCLEHALSPSSYSGDLLNYELSWHVFSLLKGVAPNAAAIRMPERLHSVFACQLEATGLCLWSVYVLACCPLSTSRRAATLQDTLCRIWPTARNERITLSNTEETLDAQTFLTDVLCFPHSWVHRAEATYARYLRRTGDEVSELLKLGSMLQRENAPAEETKVIFIQTNNLICDELFPRIVGLRSSRKDEAWRVPATQTISYLEMLAEHVSKSDCGIAQWSGRGGVLLECLGLLLNPGEPEENYDLETVHDLVERVQTFRRLSLDADAEVDGLRSIRLGDKASGLEDLRVMGVTLLSSVVAVLQRKTIVRLGTAVSEQKREQAKKDLAEMKVAPGLRYNLEVEYLDDDGGKGNMRRWALPESYYTV